MNSTALTNSPELQRQRGPTALAAMFDAWASSKAMERRSLSEPTEAVQRAMWGAFSAWCIKQEVDPTALSAAELDGYLRSREGTVPASELTPRYAWRLVTLVDRILNHDASALGRASNSAAKDLLASYPDLKHANAESMEPAPEILTDAEDCTLVAFLEGSAPAATAPESAQSWVRWQDIRNRAGVALQRGAGLTPLEIRTLKVGNVFVDRDPAKGPWKVRAPATGSVQEHDAPLARWGRPLLTYWMRLRSDLGIPGDWLFPSTRTGKPWGKTAQFEAVAEVLEGAGLTGLKGGSYRLRHTFAVRQLSRPQKTEEEVAAWMGIDVSEMKRYRGILMGPVDVL